MSKVNSIRVLSYNIHKGFTMGNRLFVLRKMREAIRKSRADLVFLQEVQGAHLKRARKVAQWPDSSQFEYLADKVWRHYAYGKNAVYDAGHHGNALLSRYPVVEWSNLNISSIPFEHRGLLHGVIAIPGRRPQVHCLCVHLGLLLRARKKQLERIWERIKQEVDGDAPLIVAGDFNDWSQKATKYLEERNHLKEAFFELFGSHPKTFPCAFPLLRLDRIYFRSLELVDAQVLSGPPWETLSDHAPLLAEFSF